MARTPGAHRGPLTWMLVFSFLVALGVPAVAEDAAACEPGEALVLPNGTIGCVHGPDPVPPNAPAAPSDDPGQYVPQDMPSVECFDDGTSGNRVQALYVVAADKPNRSSQVVPLIRRSVAEVDTIFRNSSESGGSYLTVRWVHDERCVVDVETVVVPPPADDSFAATIDALADAGYDDPGRHYLSWVDADQYCGIAVAYGDDRGGQENVNNGAYPLWARVDRDCWARDGMVEAHELTHMLGAVQSSAPNASGYGHCTDEYDIMCYVDAPGVEMDVACPDPASELLLDCNNDDYFDPSPAQGSYLATHWNVARSSFLAALEMAPPQPDPEEQEPAEGEQQKDFGDVDPLSVFRADIEWLRNSGITSGCNPPANDKFCPDATVTRGQMAAFLARALQLPDVDGDSFADDDTSPFEADIEKLAAAGITTGCGADSFCPNEPVTRGQMAAFLARGLELPSVDADSFVDDDASPYESVIERLSAAGITTGCTTDQFCPNDLVTRAQMAAFLKRALRDR